MAYRRDLPSTTSIESTDRGTTKKRLPFHFSVVSAGWTPEERTPVRETELAESVPGGAEQAITSLKNEFARKFTGDLCSQRFPA